MLFRFPKYPTRPIVARPLSYCEPSGQQTPPMTCSWAGHVTLPHGERLGHQIDWFFKYLLVKVIIISLFFIFYINPFCKESRILLKNYSRYLYLCIFSKDTAIPYLKGEGITFYNPQQDNWVPEMIELEHQVDGATVLVVDYIFGAKIQIFADVLSLIMDFLFVFSKSVTFS